MNQTTLTAFHQLMKRGLIDRRENAPAWESWMDPDAQGELEKMGEELGFDLFRTGDRVYLVPTEHNDLFLKNNVDYRRDIKAGNDVRLGDLYLLNYLAVYMVYLFFHGEGANPMTREFITKEDFLAAFSEHCKGAAEASEREDLPQTEYGENFRLLAVTWLNKLEGDPDAKAMNTRYGCLNRILLKFRADELFEADSEQRIRPTRKLTDLMPYFLRKNRVAEIHAWMEQADSDGQAQK